MTCGFARTAGFTKSSARRLAKSPSVSIERKRQPIWTRHMWVARHLIHHLVLVECLENKKIACDCNQRWVPKTKNSKTQSIHPSYLSPQTASHSHVQKKAQKECLSLSLCLDFFNKIDNDFYHTRARWKFPMQNKFLCKDDLMNFASFAFNIYYSDMTYLRKGTERPHAFCIAFKVWTFESIRLKIFNVELQIVMLWAFSFRDCAIKTVQNLFVYTTRYHIYVSSWNNFVG